MRKITLLGSFLILSVIARAQIPRIEVPTDTLRIAFLTDIHVTPGNAQDSLLELVVAEINERPCDLVVVGGDLTNMGSDAELQRVHTLLGGLRIPQFVVPGNHETTWSESACATFARLFGHDGCSALHAGNYLLIGYPSGPYMKMADGAVRREDLARIEGYAQDAAPGERLVSVCHYPLTNDLNNRGQITSLLRDLGCGVSLCGHYHQLALRNFDSLAGIQGRALVQQDTYGYNLVRLAGDSLWMDEKQVGQVPVQAFSIRLQDDPQVLALPCDPLPDTADYAGKGTLMLQDEGSVYTGVATDGKRIFYGNSLGQLKACDARTGCELWRRELGGALYTTPLYTDGLVVAGASVGGLYAFDAASGEPRWSIPTPTPVIGDGLIAGNDLYIGLGNGRMAHIDLRTGRLVWTFDFGDGQAQGRPALADGKLVFGAWNTYLYCLDAATGTLCWRWSNGSSQRLFSPGHVVPRIVAGRVYLVAPDRYTTALDLQTGRQVWRTKARKARETTGITLNGDLFYIKTMDGELVAVDTSADLYAEAWICNSGWGYDHNSCPVTVHEDVAYMANRSGCIAAVDACGKLLWRAKFCNSAANDFTVAPDGTLWVTFAEGAIFRIGKYQ